MSNPQGRFHTTSCSQGDIDYSLQMFIKRSGNTAWKLDRMMKIGHWWQQAALCYNFFFPTQNTEMLPRQWHESLLVFLVLFEDAIQRFPLILSYSLSASKAILPPVTTIIIATVILFLYVFMGLLSIIFCLCITQRIRHRSWVHCETNPGTNTGRHTQKHTYYFTFILNSEEPAKSMQNTPSKKLWISWLLYNFCPTQAPRTVHVKNRDALSDSRFGVVELSLTSRGRAGTQQKKQRAGQGKFLPGIHECLNTTGMRKWNLHDCHDNCRYGQDEARSSQAALWSLLVLLLFVLIC